MVARLDELQSGVEFANLLKGLSRNKLVIYSGLFSAILRYQSVVIPPVLPRFDDEV
jgi:hypothetical protein